jgi:hypothetical protein
VARAGMALASLVLALLAGCAGPVGQGTAIPDPGQAAEQAGLAVPPSHLEAGTFYAFRHAGGGLSLGVLPGGRAQVELFDGADQRLGQISLSDALAGGSLQLQNMPAGDYVIRTLAVNGTLRIESGGAAPALRPLAAHVERQVLLQVPRGTVPSVPALPGAPGAAPPIDRGLDLQLLRAPTSLRVLVAGDYASLDVELRSAMGPVASAHSTGFAPFNGLGNGGLSEVSTEFQVENVRDGHLTGRVQAQDLHGVILLEASSYSRAEPLASPAAPGAAPAFSYGPLPAAPVRFQTGPRASQLVLHGTPFQEGNRTWATLFDDHGHRVGTWSVATGAFLAIPVLPSAGYVAALLRGNATLGADAAPGDFELHPMQVREQVVPADPAGSNGDYGQARADLDGAGVFAIEPTVATSASGPFGFDPQFAAQCSGPAQVRIVQGNETLGFWDEGFSRQPPSSDAELRLRDGPLAVLSDGFGATGCPHAAARIKSFQA